MKVEEIIETVRNNEEVVNEVANLAKLADQLYNERIETYHPNLNIHGEYEFDNDRPVFRMDDEFDNLIDLIEDICNMNIGVYLHSNEWYEQEENIGEGISTPNTFAAYIAREITDDKFFQEGCLYEDTLCFYATDDDIFYLEGKEQLEKEFKYALIDSNEFDCVPLSDFLTADGNHTKDFTLEDAESAYRYYLSRNLYDDWVYDKDTDCLFRKETEEY